MNDKPSESPSTPGIPTSRRSLAYGTLIGLAQDLLVARFALARALDKLQTTDLLDLLDEVAETADTPSRRFHLHSVTPRDENE